ncbi:MAG: 7-cyano-7-deazaguanine synthase QueC [Myxococcales bacterium]|nr:7-cyano-7-deazaguanine synthase QueC [Myxococcales bacterium]
MATSSQAPAVVLLSGGLDSTTVLAIAAREANQRVHALSFAYGQRHGHELRYAALQASRFGVVAHEVVDLGALGRLVAPSTSLLAASPLEVPAAPDADASQTIPSTYVPARNTLFLSYALAWAEVLGARDIWIGVNAVDYSGYPDCRPEFVAAFEQTANLATKMGVSTTDDAERIRVRTPLIDLHKHEIITRGVALGVDYGDTLSCYDPRESKGPSDDESLPLACGRCDSCTLRRQGFTAAGIIDPTRYC